MSGMAMEQKKASNRKRKSRFSLSMEQCNKTSIILSLSVRINNGNDYPLLAFDLLKKIHRKCSINSDILLFYLVIRNTYSAFLWSRLSQRLPFCERIVPVALLPTKDYGWWSMNLRRRYRAGLYHDIIIMEMIPPYVRAWRTQMTAGCVSVLGPGMSRWLGIGEADDMNRFNNDCFWNDCDSLVLKYRQDSQRLDVNFGEPYPHEA